VLKASLKKKGRRLKARGKPIFKGICIIVGGAIITNKLPAYNEKVMLLLLRITKK